MPPTGAPKTNREMTAEDVAALSKPAPAKPSASHQAMEVPDTKSEFGPEGDGKLTEDEVQFILQSVLRYEQREDPKVIKFIMAYLVCRSAPQAAREAGFDSAKASYWGNKLRMTPEIHDAITKLTAKAVMKYGYDASEIIERVKEISNFDPIEFENPDGSYKTHLSMVSPEARRAIKKFKVKNIFGKDANDVPCVIGQLIEVEVWDKLKSHELLGREKNIMKETKVVEHDITKNMSSHLLESRKRAEAVRIDNARPVQALIEGDTDGTVRGSEAGDHDNAGWEGSGV